MQDQNTAVIDLATERAKRETVREDTSRQMTFEFTVEEERQS